MFVHFGIGELIITSDHKVSKMIKTYRQNNKRYIRILKKENSFLRDKVAVLRDRLIELNKKEG